MHYIRQWAIMAWRGVVDSLSLNHVFLVVLRDVLLPHLVLELGYVGLVEFFIGGSGRYLFESSIKLHLIHSLIFSFILESWITWELLHVLSVLLLLICFGVCQIRCWKTRI